MKQKLVMLCSLLWLLVACAHTWEQAAVTPDDTLYLYLQPWPQEAYNLTLTISEINARSSTGEEIPLLDGPLRISPETRLGQQTVLLSRPLPAGEYEGINLKISEAAITTEDGPLALQTDSTAVPFSTPFVITASRVQSLFLALNPERLVTDGDRLTARFSVWQPQSVLPELKGMVSHPEAGTVSFFEKVAPSVVSVVKVGRSPSGMALHKRTRRLYVAISGEDSVASIDLVREQVRRKTRLRAADRPTTMALTADGRILAVANPGTNSVSIIETGSFVDRARIALQARPTDLFISQDDRSVYVLQPEANMLTVISLEMYDLVANVTLAYSPFTGAAGSDGEFLYLLTEDSPNMLVLDAKRLTVTSEVHVGPGASCLTAPKDSRRLFVGSKSGAIVVIDPSTTLPIDWFQAGGPVVDVAYDVEQNSLFVQTATNNLLEKYDPISHKRLAVLDLTAAGYEVKVMGE